MPSEDSLSENGRKNHATLLAALWPRLIELWIAGVLIAFFIIRILGSQTARSLLNRLAHHPFR